MSPGLLTGFCGGLYLTFRGVMGASLQVEALTAGSNLQVGEKVHFLRSCVTFVSGKLRLTYSFPMLFCVLNRRVEGSNRPFHRSPSNHIYMRISISKYICDLCIYISEDIS